MIQLKGTFINTPDSFAIPFGRVRHVGVFKGLIKTQLELFKTRWLRVLGVQAHVRQLNLRGTQFIAISNIA